MANTKVNAQEQTNVETPATEAPVVQTSVFEKFAKKQLTEGNKEDVIIRQLMDSGLCQKFVVDVQDVLPDDPSQRRDDTPRYTLSFKQEVWGMLDLGTRDAANRVVKELGPVRALMFSLIDLRTAGKRNAKSALLMSGITADEDEAHQLSVIQRTFIGGRLTVIQQFVEANTEFINPFASNPKPKTYNENKVITYIVGFAPGEVASDAYMAMIAE